MAQPRHAVAEHGGDAHRHRGREQHEQRHAAAVQRHRAQRAEHEEGEVHGDPGLLDAPLATLGEHHLPARLPQVPDAQQAHDGHHRQAPGVVARVVGRLAAPDRGLLGLVVARGACEMHSMFQPPRSIPW